MNIFLSAVYRIIYTIIIFIAGLVISNIVLPDRFGLISLLIINASLFSLVTGLGSDSLVMHKLSNQKWSISQAGFFTRRTLLLQVILFIFFEVLSILVWKKTLFTNEGREYLSLDAIYFAGLILSEKYLALLYAMHKSIVAHKFLIAVGIIYISILIVFSYVLKVSYFTILYLFSLLSLIQGIILFVLFWQHVKNEPEEKLFTSELTVAYKLSSLVMVTNVVQLLAYRMDFWILKYFHGNFEVGVYAMANKFANLIWIIPNIIAQLLIPRFIGVKKADIPVIFRAAFYFNILIVTVAIFSTYLFYYYFLNIEYTAGFHSFLLMLPGYFFWASVIYYGAYFSWLGRFRYNFFCSSLCFLFIFLADLLLIPQFSIEGAAIANSLVYSLIFVVYIFVMQNKLSVKATELFLLKKEDFRYLSKFVRS